MKMLFRIHNRILLLILILSSHTFCQFSVNDYDFSPSEKWQRDLPKKLKEISGLAYASDTRLFGLNDEKGIIYQIDLGKGEIVKSFSIGKRILFKDFEGLAIAEKTFFAITNSGELYKFYEQKDGGYSNYKKLFTGLSQKFDAEGLCFDPETYSLLIACKGYSGKGNNNLKAIFSFDLNSNKINAKPRFLISLKDLKDKFNLKN